MSEIVMITGASSGIGAAAAEAFAASGSSLFLVARRLNRLQEVAARCRALGSPRCAVSCHDLSVPGQGGAAVSACLEKMAGLDVLVCNAGYGIVGSVADTPPAEMARLWQVNFQSAYESIHRALPHFYSRSAGHIVLTSSVVGKRAMPWMACYCATKFAQVGLGESLWGELRSAGIGVSVVCPGFTRTEFQESVLRTGRDRSFDRKVRGQTPDEVASVMLDAVRNRRREVHLSAPGRMLLLLDRLSPSLAVRLMAWVGSRGRNAAPPESVTSASQPEVESAGKEKRS